MKKKNTYNLWQNSAYMIRKAWSMRKHVVLQCFLLALLAVAVNLVQLYIAPIILQKVEGHVPLPELLTGIGVFALLLIVLNGLYQYFGLNTLTGRIEVRTHIIGDVNYKLQTTSYPNVEDTGVLKLLEKAQQAISSNAAATEIIWTTITDLLTNILGFGVYLLLLSSLNPFLMMVTVATTILGYFVNKKVSEWGYQHRDEEAAYLKKLNYVTTETEDRTTAKDIRIFGMRPWLEDIYKQTMGLYEAFAVKREKKYIIANITDVVLTFLRNGIAYIYLINLTLQQELPASSFLLYFSAISGFTAWVTGILNGFFDLYKNSLDISCLREFLELKEQFLFEDGKPLTPSLDKDYTIELRNVSYRYPESDRYIIRNLNLTLHPGEKLAIVGLNGAGKTTLIKLLCGFYDPTEGWVLLNGQDIRQYNRRDYYRMFAAVFQQFSVLETTLTENISQTIEKADAAMVKDCIEKAGLTEKVAELPAHENTHIGRSVYEDGVELSGGQTQRLMLARALYKNAPIIVLDEPTAALDPIAENDIYMKYNEMTKERSSVFISHRLASTRFCDRIILLADGNIAEEGTHESLMALNKEYATLFNIQSKYYQEGGDEHEEAL